MTYRYQPSILAILLVASGMLIAGCSEPAAPAPPTLTPDDAAEIIASILGNASGGMAMQIPDLMTIARGEKPVAGNTNGKAPSPLVTQSVRRNDSTAEPAGSYSYDFTATYTYFYTYSGVDKIVNADRLDKNTSGVRIECEMEGTFATPSLSGTDNGSVHWPVLGLEPGAKLYKIDQGSYNRHRSITLRKKDLSLSLDALMTIRHMEIDPSSGTLASADTATDITLTNLQWSGGSAIMIDANTPLTYGANIRFIPDGTALLLLNDGKKGYRYTLDLGKGEVMRK